MYGTNYVWILPGYHEDKWWKNVEETNCTQSDLEEVLKWHFALEFAPERPNIEMPVVGNKVGKFWLVYQFDSSTS